MASFQSLLQNIAREQEYKKQLAEQRQREAEAEAKRRTFRWESLLPSLITTALGVATGGTSLAAAPGFFAGQALPSAIGEGARAATGSDLDLGSLASTLWGKYAPSAPAATQAPEVAGDLGYQGEIPVSLREKMSRNLGLDQSLLQRKLGGGRISPLSQQTMAAQLPKLASQGIRGGAPQPIPQQNVLEQLLSSITQTQGEGFQQGLYKQETQQEKKARQLMEKLEPSSVTQGAEGGYSIGYSRPEKDYVKEFLAKERAKQGLKPPVVSLSNLSELGKEAYRKVLTYIKLRGDEGIGEAVRQLGLVTEISPDEKNFILSKIPMRRTYKPVVKKQRPLN